MFGLTSMAMTKADSMLKTLMSEVKVPSTRVLEMMERILYEYINQLQAKVNGADKDGYVPLHYFAMAKRPEAINTLLEEGRSNLTIRNEQTR